MYALLQLLDVHAVANAIASDDGLHPRVSGPSGAAGHARCWRRREVCWASGGPGRSCRIEAVVAAAAAAGSTSLMSLCCPEATVESGREVEPGRPVPLERVHALGELGARISPWKTVGTAIAGGLCSSWFTMSRTRPTSVLTWLNASATTAPSAGRSLWRFSR